MEPSGSDEDDTHRVGVVHIVVVSIAARGTFGNMDTDANGMGMDTILVFLIPNFTQERWARREQNCVRVPRGRGGETLDVDARTLLYYARGCVP